MRTKLTVFIPNYNKEKYLSQTLSSVLMQKTSFDFKILIIDDASTDSSVEIIKSFIKKYPKKIDFFRNKKNLKCTATTLKGYKKIKSEYFCVLDSDDYWIDKNKLQNAVNFLDSHKDFTIYMANNYIKDKSKKLQPYFSHESYDFDFSNLANATFGHTSGTIFRNVVFTKNIPKVAFDSIGTVEEDLFEGDSFRNIIHLKEGKAHFENRLESVYRITGGGIWTSLNSFQQNSLNARFYLKMFLLFDKTQPEFFINTCWHFCQKNIHLLANLTNNQDIKSVDINEINSWQELLVSCLKFRNDLLPSKSDCYINRTFVFFLPSRTVGGYEYLFIRLAKYLSKILHFDVYYVDYVDGFARKQLNNSEVKFIDYQGTDTFVNIDLPVNLISPITMSHEIPKLKNFSSKLIFWCAHPKSISWLSYRSGMNNKNLEDFLNILKKENSVCFMDWSCWQSTNEISNIDFSETYVPIFSTHDKKYISKNLNKNIHKKEINIGWLGRLDFDKIYSLINLLDNFNKLKTKFKKNIHIIGDGDSKNLIDISKYKNINIFFTSTLINSDLHRYLNNHIDILFAMGTSCLEAAKLKIPSVLVYSSTIPFEDDKFVWLFDSKKYILGLYTTQKFSENLDIHGLSTILNYIYKAKLKKELGLKCYSYSEQYHHIDKTVHSLLSLTMDSSFSYDKYFLHEKINNTYSTDQNIKKKTKIFVSFFNGINDPKNLNAMPCFYESFLEGLKNSGNDVLYVSNPTWLPNNLFNPELFLEKIKNFNPDLIILFNNVCWVDLSKKFECPIIIYDVDSPLYYGDKDILNKDPNRYKYIVPQTESIEILKHSLGVSELNISYIPFFTSVTSKKLPQTNNICFIGTNFPYSNNISNLLKNTNNRDGVLQIKNLLKFIENNPFSTIDLISKEFNKIPSQTLENLNIQQLVFDISSKNRVQILSEISDLGLSLYGPNNWTEITNEPEIALSYKSNSVYSLKHNENVYNSSKISLNINHIQATSGFSWRVFDIMASNSCLLTQPSKDFLHLFPNIKVPTYTSKFEAREKCIELLKNESLRKDIVYNCQDVINKNYRFANLIDKIENFVNVSLKSKNIGSLKKIELMTDSNIKNNKNSYINDKFRITTRSKLMIYSIMLFLNQIPLINKPLISRSEIIDKINKTI